MWGYHHSGVNVREDERIEKVINLTLKELSDVFQCEYGLLHTSLLFQIFSFFYITIMVVIKICNQDKKNCENDKEKKMQKPENTLVCNRPKPSPKTDKIIRQCTLELYFTNQTWLKIFISIWFQSDQVVLCKMNDFNMTVFKMSHSLRTLKDDWHYNDSTLNSAFVGRGDGA